MLESPLRSSIDRRRYRLAQAATVAGSLALGSLVVNRLVAAFRGDLVLFYGISDPEYRVMQATADGQLPVTLGKLMFAAIALAAVCFFVWSERRRLQQKCDLDVACRRRRTAVVVQRLHVGALFDAFVMRTSIFAAVLLALWLLQSCLERWLGGMGWNLAYDGWRSILPLASIFGLCVLAGMLVAAVSLIGLRAIHVLEVVLSRITRRRTPRRRPHARRVVERVLRTVRELIGCDILSRPPPVAC